MRKFFDRIPLKFINYVFWLLLIYLIAALGWWYIELDQQNDLMLAFQLEQAIKNSAMVPGAIEAVQDAHNRNAKQYIGEGLTFLIITILGAVFVYSVVRRQIRFHLQQKNFMMAVTHELKTPIAVTKLNLETLRRHKLDEARQSKILGDAINETERLDSLCNNILLSSQLESGGYQLTKQEFDCAEMLSSAVSAFQKRYPTRSFALQVPGAVLLNGEEFLIRLVLNNLIENAVKYTTPDMPISVSLEDQEHQAIIKVADLGAGIPDAEKQKVFEKFYRVGDESKRTTKGTGLGLYLSTKIVKDHKGSVTIENNHPVGTVFKVILPKNRS
jgi:two-component system sensor histidine kinase CiaH